MDHARHLFFESAVAGAAVGIGGRIRGIRDLGFLAVAPAAHAAVASAVVLGIVAWWFTIAPSHNRNWRPEVAVMPRAFIDGDHVRITGVRNFDYRSRNDFTVH